MNKKGKIIPLADRVLIRPFTEAEARGDKKKSVLILPDGKDREKSSQGEVLAVGPGRHEDGRLVPMSVKVGDTVVFSKYSYDEVQSGEETLYLLKEENIFAVIK